MSIKEQSFKTRYQSNHHARYEPCSTQIQFYTEQTKNQRQFEIVSQPNLKKSLSCSTFNNYFVQSLITKMRGVPRPLSNQNALQQVNEKLVRTNLKLYKSRQKLESYKESFTPSQVKIGQPLPKLQNKKLYSQQDKLRNEIASLLKENKRLQQAIKGLQCQLFYEKQKVEHLTSDLQNKQQLIQQMEQQINLHLNKDNDNQNSSNIKDPYSFQIYKTLNQFVLGAPSIQKISLLKANAEIINLKRQLLSLQKTHFNKQAQLNRMKNEQIDHLRKTFSANLRHYKTMIIKCTSNKRGNENNSKQGQQVMQSTLLQNSSILQI